MKLNKIILSAALLVGAFTATAQEEVTEYTFNPYWYLQAQVGGQETLGEGSFGKLLSPNAQLAVGYKFNPYIGARLALNSWQSKGILNVFEDTYRWKWNYIAPTVEAVFDMTNVLGGYNPERLVDVNVFAGIGANFGFKNDEANAISASYAAANDGYQPLRLLWDGTKTRFLGKFGVDVNFNISKSVALGIELAANVLPDGYNSKKAGNADWYFNGLVGVRYTFGTKYTKSVRKAPEPEVRIVEKVVEKIVEVPVEQPVTNAMAPVKKNDTYRVDVFFTISNSTVSKAEMTKVEEMASYLTKHPEASVTVTGYADKGTGSRAINMRLSYERAMAVAKALTTKYKIDPGRVIVKSMGEAEDQPYAEPVKNRVAICIAD